MAENIEIKARCLNFNATLNKVKEIALEYIGSDFQRDTYYRVKNGRLKLRESQMDGAYLIPYIRPDRTNPRKSFYAKINIDTPEEVRNLFHGILGIHAIVSKRREIYLYENVRIHLDKVEHLGEFIELEAVLDALHSDAETERKKIKYLMHEFQIKKEDLIAESYETMIKNL